jgi:hypothetical protein
MQTTNFFYAKVIANRFEKSTHPTGLNHRGGADAQSQASFSCVAPPDLGLIDRFEGKSGQVRWLIVFEGKSGQVLSCVPSNLCHLAVTGIERLMVHR